jgi:2,3-bisphosphoglycerate-dependent phosphoglycerate mutase
MPQTTGTLILVRHGESQWNLENRFSGWVDVPLTANGEAEAAEAGRLLRGIVFSHAFTSALTRAQETLRIILDVIGEPEVPTIRDAALNERHYGDLQGLSKDEMAQRFGADEVMMWRRSYRYRPTNGESLEDTANRVLPFYRAQIEPRVRAGENVLVVAHGNSLRSLVMVLDAIPEEDIPDLYIPTGIPLRYVLDANGAVLERGAIEGA